MHNARNSRMLSLQTRDGHET